MRFKSTKMVIRVSEPGLYPESGISGHVNLWEQKNASHSPLASKAEYTRSIATIRRNGSYGELAQEEWRFHFLASFGNNIHDYGLMGWHVILKKNAR